MPTDEDDQDGHFFFNHPEREGYFASWVGAQLLLTLLKSNANAKKKCQRHPKYLEASDAP